MALRSFVQPVDRSTTLERASFSAPEHGHAPQAFGPPRPEVKPLFLHHDRMLRRVDRASISRIVTAGRYVFIHAGACRFRLRASLGDVLKQVGGHPFHQVNRNEAVNVDRVQRVEHEAVHVEGQALILSRCYRNAFLQQLTIVGDR